MDLRQLFLDTVEFFAGDVMRIQHFTKVHAFAKIIAETENICGMELNTIEAAAIVHDTGIKPAEAKYNRSDGKLQEQEGPAVARPLLERAGATLEQIERICFLVAHHHTYTDINGNDYRILVEADFLVNIFEDSIPTARILVIRDKIFRTATGTKLLNIMFNLP